MMNGSSGRFSIHNIAINGVNFDRIIRHVIVSIYILIHDHLRHL